MKGRDSRKMAVGEIVWVAVREEEGEGESPETCWWPGLIKRVDSLGVFVSFFNLQIPRYFHQSQIHSFDENFQLPLLDYKNTAAYRKRDALLDCALRLLYRRTVMSLRCRCLSQMAESKESDLVGDNGGFEAKRSFRSAGVLGFVQSVAILPWVEARDYVGAVKRFAQVQAFRGYCAIKQKSIYQKAKRQWGNERVQGVAESNHNDLPLVLVHGLPSLDLALTRILQTHFRILDPHHSSQSLDSFLTSHAQSVRAIIVYALSPLIADTIRLLPSLELVVGTSVGVDHIDISECRIRGITVTNAGDAFAEDVADSAVALLINVLRRVSAGDRYVRSGLWRLRGEYALGSKLGGKQVGIVGLGRIGSQVAQRLMAFGCRIAYNSRKKKPSVQYPYYASVCDLATNSDVLIVCCPLTSETHHLINKEVMKALGKEGVIVNVGRGGLVDEQELVQFLTRGEIGGAGLDVFEKEPDVPRELFALDNVVLSPHNAVLTPESIEAVYQLILANLKSFFSNKPLRSVVQQE